MKAFLGAKCLKNQFLKLEKHEQTKEIVEKITYS